MNLNWIDWAIMAAAVLALRFASLYTRKYMKGVADFLSANRCAGRYLLTIASQMGSFGVITVVANFEVLNSAGLSPQWWQILYVPAIVVVALTGWVYYRYRETRVLTMGQFFEMRYSRKFRINAGIMCWVSGVINFGIFPGVAARFLIYFCGLPEYFHLPGVPFHLNTFAVVMAIDLLLALSFVLMGGQISVMITECLQGMFCTIAFLVVCMVILLSFSWPQMVHALELGSKANASAINPFRTSGVTDFNVWYYIIAIFGTFYTYLSWQGSQAFNSSARSPHEQKMGQVIGSWRAIPQALAVILLGLAALVVMRVPEFCQQASVINKSLSHIHNETVRGQMMLPIALASILPLGIKGLVGTIMLFISFTCHDTYMHSWGSIFIQDVYMPIRNKALSPTEHIRLLRLSIIGVAIFTYFFSLFYPPDMPIYMFFATTGTIWLGGSGAVILGGLYWRRGTTTAAFLALYGGGAFGLIGLWLPSAWKAVYHSKFPINGQWLWFIAMIFSLVIYTSVSLITGRGKEPFNLEKILHRGKYSDGAAPIANEYKGSIWSRIIGITPEFSRQDKFLAVFLVVWNGLNLLWFAIFSAINIVFPITDRAWGSYWYVFIVINAILSAPCAVWFTVGGVLDIRALFRHLSTITRDDNDDGRVTGSMNEAETQLAHTTESQDDIIGEMVSKRSQ